MVFAQILGIGALAVLTLMTILWVISIIRKDASIVDIFWGVGFVVLSGIYFILATEGYGLRKLILIALVTVWGGETWKPHLF